MNYGPKVQWSGAGLQGTKVAAILYSLIESAKLAGINPQQYLQTATEAALRGNQIPLPHEIA